MLAWSFTTLPVAAKYQMSSVADFLKLETAFTVLQFAIVAPLIAWAYRGAPNPSAMALPLARRAAACLMTPISPRLCEKRCAGAPV
jgi:hypothetical protein